MRKLLLAMLLVFVGYGIYRHYFFVDTDKVKQTTKVTTDKNLVNVSDIDIKNLAFEGKYGDKIHYFISSSLATQVEDKIFNLKVVDAEYIFGKKEKVLLSAKNVLFNQKHDIVYFDKNINISTKDYRIYTDYMEVDFGKFLLHAKNGIRLKGKELDLVSDECSISNDYKDIIFSGNVKTDINFNALRK